MQSFRLLLEPHLLTVVRVRVLTLVDEVIFYRQRSLGLQHARWAPQKPRSKQVRVIAHQATLASPQLVLVIGIRVDLPHSAYPNVAPRERL